MLNVLLNLLLIGAKYIVYSYLTYSQRVLCEGAGLCDACVRTGYVCRVGPDFQPMSFQSLTRADRQGTPACIVSLSLAVATRLCLAEKIR